jgi:hypothetical protein
MANYPEIRQLLLQYLQGGITDMKPHVADRAVENRYIHFKRKVMMSFNQNKEAHMTELKISNESFKSCFDCAGTSALLLDTVNNLQVSSHGGSRQGAGSGGGSKGKGSGKKTGRRVRAADTADDSSISVKLRSGPKRSAVLKIKDTAQFESLVIGYPIWSFLVNFFDPNCPNCEEFHSAYDKIVLAFSGDSSVVVASVNAIKCADLATKYNITTYPTLILFVSVDGEHQLQTYAGNQDLLSVVQFVNEYVGTFRKVDGSINAQAGRIKELDDKVDLASSVDTILINSLKGVLVGSNLSVDEKNSANLYIAIAQRIKRDGKNFYVKESNRLDGLLSISKVRKSEKSSMKHTVKKNILGVFRKFVDTS